MSNIHPLRHLFLGGARSGKSALAEAAAHAWLQQFPKGQVVYVATAQVLDKEMQARVALHQQRRPSSWLVLEEPMQLAQVLNSLPQKPQQPVCFLIDCLTLWLSNQLCQQVKVDADNVMLAEQAIDELLACLAEHEGSVLLVSNEVGSGIVPMGELSRQFQNLSGIMNQRLAQACERVTLAVAGLPMQLK